MPQPVVPLLLAATHTRCPHSATVSLCRTAKDAAEAIEGGVPIPNERQHQGKAASGGGVGGGILHPGRPV